MKEIIKKNLIINQLVLPNELINIIKEYVFYNIIEESKKRKNRIISLLNNKNFYYGKYHIPENSDFPYPIICIDNKDREKYFNLTYCEQCGKYIRLERLITYLHKYIHCNC